jgi:hypothetical protein
VAGKRKKDEPKIRRPDQSQKVKVGSVSIVGSTSSGSISITAGRDVVTNIGGGSISGDVYLASRTEDDLPEQMEEAIDRENLPPDEKEHLLGAINEVKKEIEKGNDSDEGLISFLLKSIGNTSHDVLSILVESIISQENVPPQVRRLVKGTLKSSYASAKSI